MAKIKLTKTAVDAARPKEREYELRDTIVPGFMLKVTPFGGKIFMLAYVTNSGVRRKPALGRFKNSPSIRPATWHRTGSRRFVMDATRARRRQPRAQHRP